MQFLTIGKLAKETNVNIETVRYYERIGLIPEPPRGTSSGYRQYPMQVVSRIKFIKRAQSLGFSLKEINDILTIRYKPDSSFNDIKNKIETKLEEIDEIIKGLHEMKKALIKLIKSSNIKINEIEWPVLSLVFIKYTTT